MFLGLYYWTLLAAIKLSLKDLQDKYTSESSIYN